MRKIQLKDAKANLSAVVDQATQGKPSVHYPARQTRGGGSWLCRLAAVIPGAFLRSASEMSVPLESGDLPERNRAADARRRPVTRYLVDTNVRSATAPTTAVRRLELIEWMDFAFARPFPVGNHYCGNRRWHCES